MSASKYGTGTLRKRGDIWHVVYWIDGKQYQKSSKSSDIQKAKKLRDQILGQKARGELGYSTADTITCGELLDDVLSHVAANGKASTAKVWKLVVEANLRPFFGHLKAKAVSSERLRQYREKRIAAGRSDSTANRELSILRTGFHLGRKQTPPKVLSVPYFPMTSEDGNARQGFLTDGQYVKLRDALPPHLKPLFVVAYFTGIRRGELLSIRWSQIDFEKRVITLRRMETKASVARAVPILNGDMLELLQAAQEDCLRRVAAREGVPLAKVDSADYPVFANPSSPTEALKDFRGSWESAAKAVGLPNLKFHDLRRSAVVRMRRAGVPQVVRMKITGHKTDSMDRRYGIVDTDDIELARDLMEKLGKPERKD